MIEPPFWVRPPWPGASYRQALRAFHKVLAPKTYFEIGVDTGATLALARCAALAVDPKFAIDRPVLEGKPRCLLFQSTSDDFFRDHDPAALLGGPIDLAFLDGLHEHETLMRDFRNVERSCRPNSVILLHDCLPVDAHVARRSQSDQRLADLSAKPRHWAGDVWKVLAVLMKARPDLRIATFDAAPTGLVAITDLAPANPPPDEVYAVHLAEVAPLDLSAHADLFYAALNMQSSPTEADNSSLAAWLSS